MGPKLKLFLLRWGITTMAVLVATYVLDGISSKSTGGLIVASLVLGMLNAVLRPLLIIISLPLLILSLGLFTLIINAGLLYLTSALVDSFVVKNFWAALWGGIIISIVSMILNVMTGANEAKVNVQRGKDVDRTPPPQPPAGKGPIIDV